MTFLKKAVNQPVSIRQKARYQCSHSVAFMRPVALLLDPAGSHVYNAALFQVYMTLSLLQPPPLGSRAPSLGPRARSSLRVYKVPTECDALSLTVCPLFACGLLPNEFKFWLHKCLFPMPKNNKYTHNSFEYRLSLFVQSDPLYYALRGYIGNLGNIYTKIKACSKKKNTRLRKMRPITRP